MRYALLFVVLCSIVGCGGASVSSQSQAAPGRDTVRRRIVPTYPTVTSMVFEADYDEAAINIYRTFDLAHNPAPVAWIAVARGCPYGMAMDKTGMLYVVDNCGGNDVEEYAKGQTTLKKTITDGISNPLGIAIDAYDRVYVSNYPAAISIYGRGKTKPSRIVSGSPLENPCGLAIDKQGDLFIADYGAGRVFELAVGASTVTALNLQDLAEPLGVGIDQRNGYLWVTDGAGDKINVYQPGQTAPTGTIAGNGSPYTITSKTEASRNMRSSSRICSPTRSTPTIPSDTRSTRRSRMASSARPAY